MSENVKVDQSLRRFHPTPCRSCHGIAKRKCMFCGQQWKLRKMDMSDMEIIQYDSHVERIEYLKKLYRQLVAFRMTKFNIKPENDGCLEELEKDIIAWVGDWRSEL